MNWIIAIAVAIALVVVLFVWMIWVGGGRNIGRDSFPNQIRHLLILGENGAHKRFNDRESDFWFSLERLKASDSSAVLALRIPRRDSTLAAADELRKTYDAHGFEWAEEEDNPSLLAKVLIPVEDIWTKSSGARGAHAARLLLDASGVPQNARFNIEEGGHRSKRWKTKDISELSS